MSTDYVAGVRLKDLADEVTAKHTSARDIFMLPVDQVYFSKTVITCKEEETIDAAFESLIANKILSLPVWSKAKNRYVGLVDVTDFVTFISHHFDQDILKADDVKQFFSAKDRFTSHLVKNLSNISERNPWYPVENDAPLVRLVDTFCRGNIHRLPIVENNGDLYTMVSQTDMVAYIVSHLKSEFLAKLAAQKLQEKKIGNWEGVYSVKASDPALDAFKLIQEKKVQGVAVVDEDGKLVSNISASDLRLIENHGASLSVLFKSCSEFVELAHGGKKKIVTVSKDSTYEEASTTMHNSRTHRLYVTDEQGRPIAVVSQYDIIKALQAFLN